MATTKKKGSFRRNVIVTFLTIAVISMTVTGLISLAFVDLTGGYTTDQSSDALQDQIERNMGQTAESNSLVVRQKLESAEGMVNAMAEEVESLFESDSTYRPREVYYDYFFQNPAEGPTPCDVQYEEEYGINVSWNYSSWYVPGSNSTNYETYEAVQSAKLDRVSNMDYIFQYIHAQMPEFRWLYVGFENDLWINYPGSIVGGSTSERNNPALHFKASEEAWYQDLRAAGRNTVFVEPYYDPIDGVLLISIGRAFYNETGQVMGIIAGDITVDDIRNKILDVEILETGYAALITSGGGIVAHPNVEDRHYGLYDDELPPLEDFEVNSDISPAQIAQITSGNTGTTTFRKEGDEFILAYTPVGVGGYICIIIVPREEALAAIPALEARIQNADLQATTFIVAVTVGGILIAGAVAVVVSNQITRPLQYLMDLANRNVSAMIKQERLDTSDLQVDRVYTGKDDEIGELARAFQGMLDTIREEESEE
jgi:HAMP domain-containing protein